MSLLRWILLAAGLVLIAAIYIWDRRNRRTQPSDRLSTRPVAPSLDQPRGSDRQAAAHVPELDDSVVVHTRVTERPLTITSTEAALDTDDLPPMHAGIAPDVRASQYEGPTVAASDIDVPRDSQFTGMNTGTFITESARRSGHARSPDETQSGPTIAVATLAPAPVAPSRSPPPKNPASRKIVALRLSAGSERVEGARLKMLLESAGLRHGKYNIYHRLHSDDTPLFSVASMVEPGTFDPYAMSGVQFPGVTIFVQLPTVIDGGDAFERMLLCARELEQGIGGLLQDERGLPLTEQRAQRLRDDVTDFMHLMGPS